MAQSTQTGTNLVTQALKIIGRLAPGDSPSTDELTDGLTSLNRMIKSWENINDIISVRVLEGFTLTVGKFSYTIGSGLDLDTAIVPVQLEDAYVRDSSNSDHFLNVEGRQYYNKIYDKTVQGRPEIVYYDEVVGSETVYVYPAPFLAETLYLDSVKPVETIVAGTAIVLPARYEDAIVYNLAVRLVLEHYRRSMTLDPEIRRIAFAEKNKVKTFNKSHEVPRMEIDPTLTERGKYNVYSDRHRNRWR